MFEVFIYTLFYLVFPTAPDTSNLPSDVEPWRPQYWHGVSTAGVAHAEIDALLNRCSPLEDMYCWTHQEEIVE
jgi:hypothetical protein